MNNSHILEMARIKLTVGLPEAGNADAINVEVAMIQDCGGRLIIKKCKFVRVCMCVHNGAFE